MDVLKTKVGKRMLGRAKACVTLTNFGGVAIDAKRVAKALRANGVRVPVKDVAARIVRYGGARELAVYMAGVVLEKFP